MMQTIGISDEQAEDALVQLAEHVGMAVPLGRPLVAMPGSDGSVYILTTDCQWWAYSDHASSLGEVAGEIELVEYAGGSETSRHVTIIG